MGPTPITPQTGELFKQPLAEQINMRHPLVQLAGLIDWQAPASAVGELHFEAWPPGDTPATDRRPAVPAACIRPVR